MNIFTLLVIVLLVLVLTGGGWVGWQRYPGPAVPGAISVIVFVLLLLLLLRYF